MPQWELQRVWVKRDTDSDIDELDTDTGWQEAEQLAKKGWELVGAVPITGQGTFGITSTHGYTLIFKRQIS